MTGRECAIEIARLLLENEIRYLAKQKEMAVASQSAKNDDATAPQTTPAKRRGKKGV